MRVTLTGCLVIIAAVATVALIALKISGQHIPLLIFLAPIAAAIVIRVAVLLIATAISRRGR